jgi:hypothetical protein
MRSDRGQGSVEWIAATLVVVSVLAVGTTTVSAGNAMWLPQRLVCAVLRSCRGEAAALERAYGRAAGLVRAYAPAIAYEPGTLTLPVDFRRCRRHACADGPEGAGADVWESDRGSRATVFTHVVDGSDRGEPTYIQYWLYYPDSTYNGAAYAIARAGGGVLAWTPAGRIARAAAGHHEDDWESYQVRIDPDGRVYARASAHNGYAGPKRRFNLNELPPRVLGVEVPRHDAWTPVTGWTRVSRGSHAGHLIYGADPGERRTESNGISIVPIEILGDDALGADFAITPPWRKPVYDEPARDDT